MKNLIIILLLLTVSIQAVYAEKIPIKITAAQEISTHKNEVEIGDWIKFKTVNDVYYNDNIFIKKDTPVTGIVDNIHENGIIADNAEITFKKFLLRNADDKLITINYTLVLSRNNSKCYTLSDKIAKYAGFILKGNEIRVKPNTTTYNLFFDK